MNLKLHNIECIFCFPTVLAAVLSLTSPHKHRSDLATEEPSDFQFTRLLICCIQDLQFATGWENENKLSNMPQSTGTTYLWFILHSFHPTFLSVFTAAHKIWAGYE